MRGSELIVVGLLLISGGTASSVGLLDIPAGTGQVEGEVIFTSADYTGPATVEADDAVLYNEGPLDVTVAAEQVTVHRYEVWGALVHARLFNGSEVHVGRAAGTHSWRNYDNATVRIESGMASDPGVTSIWSDASGGPERYRLALDDRMTPSLLASRNGTYLWKRYDDAFEHELPGPVFAFGHNGTTFQHAHTSQAGSHPRLEGARFQGLRARGGFELIIFGGTIDLEGDDDEATYRTGRDAVDVGTGIASTTTTTHRVMARVEVVNASLTVSFDRDSRSRFFAWEPTWYLNGSLTFRSQEGLLRTEATNVSAADDEVTLDGNTTLRLETVDDPNSLTALDPGRLGSDSGRPAIRGTIDSNARALKVGDEPVQVADQTGISDEASLFAKIVGVVLVVWAGLKKLGPALLGALARDPLDNDRRRRIYEHLREAGLGHPRAVARELGIHHSSASYHMRVLLEAGLLARVRREGRTVYFPCSETTRDERERLALLASPTRRRIAEILLDRGRSTQGEILDDLDRSRSTVAEHLGKLAEAGLVETNGNQAIEYRPSELLREWIRGPASHDT